MRDVADTTNEVELSQDWLLSDIIRKTRGCHIEAERRLLARAALVNHANLYYGCWSAILTILTLDSRYSSLSVPAACFASSVALWAAYASAEKYELRAKDFYASYLDLQRLWIECEEIERGHVTGGKLEKTIEDVRREYMQILHSTENHSEADYIRYAYKNHEKHSENDNISKSFIIKYYMNNLIWPIILRAFVYVVIPAVLLKAPQLITMLIAVMG